MDGDRGQQVKWTKGGGATTTSLAMARWRWRLGVWCRCTDEHQSSVCVLEAYLLDFRHMLCGLLCSLQLLSFGCLTETYVFGDLSQRPFCYILNWDLFNILGKPSATYNLLNLVVNILSNNYCPLCQMSHVMLSFDLLLLVENVFLCLNDFILLSLF